MATLTAQQRRRFLREIDDELHRIKQRLNQYASITERMYAVALKVPGEDIWVGPAANRFHTQIRHIASSMFNLKADLTHQEHQLSRRRAELEAMSGP